MVYFVSKVVVVGAGIVGRFIAYSLTQRGVAVEIIDPGPDPSMTTTASLGVLTHFNGGDDPYSLFYQDSFLSYCHHAAQLESDTGIDIGWRPLGGVDLILNDDDEEVAVKTVDFNRSRNCTVEELDRNQLLELEPGVTDKVRGGLFFPDDQRVNPAGLASALLRAIEQRGGAIRFGERVLDFESVDARGISLKTMSARLHADVVVLAAGCWTAELAGNLGARVPVRPIRGQHCRFADVEVAHVVRHGGYHLLPSESLTVAGATVEEVGFDQTTTTAAKTELSKFLERTVVGSGNFCSQWAGLRPKPKGGRPLIGPLEEHPQVFVATGHYKNGIQLAPATAEAVTSWIIDGDPKRDMSRFKPER